MHITIDQFLAALSTVLAVLTTISQSALGKTKYVKVVAEAVAAAEKAIDKTAFSDQGKLDEARVDFAVAVVAKVFPKINPATIKADIEAVLDVVHQHINSIVPAK